MSLVYDGGVRPGRISLNRFVGADLDLAGQDLRPVPAQGHDRARLRRRHRRLRSEPDDHAGGQDAHMNCDYNPYEGRQVTGATDTVLSRGSLVIDNGAFVGRKGAGNFLKRATRT
jgi:dihydropyrimidinase